MNRVSSKILEIRNGIIDSLHRQIYRLGSFAAAGPIPEEEFIKTHTMIEVLKGTHNILKKESIPRRKLDQEIKALQDFDNSITNFRSLWRNAEYETQFLNDLIADYGKLKKTLKNINEILES